jgi:hypothetical protein
VRGDDHDEKEDRISKEGLSKISNQKVMMNCLSFGVSFFMFSRSSLPLCFEGADLGIKGIKGHISRLWPNFFLEERKKGLANGLPDSSFTAAVSSGRWLARWFED